MEKERVRDRKVRERKKEAARKIATQRERGREIRKKGGGVIPKRHRNTKREKQTGREGMRARQRGRYILR